MTNDERTRPAPTRSRAALLRDAGRTAVVLTFGGAALATVEAPASAAGGGEAEVLRLLAAGERLAIELYRRAQAVPGVGATLGIWIEGAISNERDHARALAGEVPATAIGAVALAPGLRLASAGDILRVAHSLEAALLGAYLGAVETLTRPDLLALAAAIGANEAQHLAALERLRAGHMLGSDALAGALSTGAARAALGAHAAGSLPA